jgi:hypothetical protein
LNSTYSPIDLLLVDTFQLIFKGIFFVTIHFLDFYCYQYGFPLGMLHVDDFSGSTSSRNYQDRLLSVLFCILFLHLIRRVDFRHWVPGWFESWLPWQWPLHLYVPMKFEAKHPSFANGTQMCTSGSSEHDIYSRQHMAFGASWEQSFDLKGIVQNLLFQVSIFRWQCTLPTLSTMT